MRLTKAFATSGLGVLAALAIGGRFGPGPRHKRTAAWYASLRKPGFTPPGAAYGMAWTMLGGALIYAGSRLLAAPAQPAKREAIALWTANVVGIAVWPAVFFGRKNLPASVVTAGGMTGIAAVAAAAAARVDRNAGVASLPLVGWLVFASVLNGEIWRENRRSP